MIPAGCALVSWRNRGHRGCAAETALWTSSIRCARKVRRLQNGRAVICDEDFNKLSAAEAPQALQALALDLGFRYSSALYHRFPELCQAMVRKNRRWRQSEDDKIRHTLSQAATENPPPSMKEVAARLGYSATALRARFPELSAALAARKPESQLLDKERWRTATGSAPAGPARLSDGCRAIDRQIGWSPAKPLPTTMQADLCSLRRSKEAGRRSNATPVLRGDSVCGNGPSRTRHPSFP